MKELTGLNGTGLVVAQDFATAACGLLNAGYFLGYGCRLGTLRARRFGALALVLVSAAAVVESLFSEALFWSERGFEPAGGLTPETWALVRLPLLLATVFISVLIVRRVAA